MAENSFTIEEKMSDRHFPSMLAENNLKAWEHLYDKYAPAMYGIICNLTEDEVVAEEILTGAFLQIKEKKTFLENGHALCISLLRHTHNYALQQLKRQGINPKASSLSETATLINLLCTRHDSLKEVAFICNITEEDAKKKLRLEFLELRNKKRSEENHLHTVSIENNSFTNILNKL